MNNPDAEPTELTVIREVPDTPEARARIAKHVAWLTVKYRMNRALAGLGPLTMTFNDLNPKDDSGSDVSYIVQTLISPPDHPARSTES